MGVYAIGIDAVEIERIARLIDRYGDRFIQRVFTPTEIAYCSRKVTFASSYAARFATKEAVFKATGFGLSMGMRWKDVEVKNDARGKPHVNLYGPTSERLKGKRIHLSITHARELAIAMIVVEDVDA